MSLVETPKDDARTRNLFKQGQSGNPAGRPKGSRVKISEAFIAAMSDDFAEHGSRVIERVRNEKPADYFKIIAGLLTKDVNIKVSNLDDLTDEQLLNKLNSLTEMARPLLAKLGHDAARADAGVERAVDAEYTEISKP